MKKYFVLVLVVVNFSLSFAEDITITTYYPSPHGSYDELGANKLAVDINGVAVPTEYAAMNNGDVHIGRSLIIGAGGGSGYAYDEVTTPPADGILLVKDKTGIGTNNPGSKLDVRGSSTKATNAVLENILRIASSDTTNPFALRVGIKTDATAANRYAALDVDDAGTKRNLVLQPSGGGLVGIGTTNPKAGLDIMDSGGNGTYGGYLHVGGNTDPVTPNQGAYLGWNAVIPVAGGAGETDFINNQGSAADPNTAGGFAFMNTPSSGSPRTTLVRILGAGNVGIGTTTPHRSARVTVAKPSGSMFDDIYIGKRESGGGCWADFEQGVSVGNAGLGSASSIVGALGYYKCLYGVTGPRVAGYFKNTNSTAYDYSVFADKSIRVGSYPDGVVIKNSTPFLTDNGGSIMFGSYDNVSITSATASIDAGWQLANNPAIQMVVTRDGKNYYFKAEYNGWTSINSINLLFTGLAGGTAYKPGGGAWAASSDIRLKKNVKPLEGALARMLKLKGVTFEWKEPSKEGDLKGKQIGFIGQEVKKVFPEWITYNKDGYLAVSIRGFEALTVEAIRELKNENERLEKRIAELEKKLAN